MWKVWLELVRSSYTREWIVQGLFLMPNCYEQLVRSFPASDQKQKRFRNVLKIHRNSYDIWSHNSTAKNAHNRTLLRCPGGTSMLRILLLQLLKDTYFSQLLEASASKKPNHLPRLGNYSTKTNPYGWNYRPPNFPANNQKQKRSKNVLKNHGKSFW